MYVMNQPTKWDDFLHLVEFSYKNKYQATIKMSLFESLYGGKCHTPLSWSQAEDKFILGPNALLEMEKIVQKICENIKIAHV